MSHFTRRSLLAGLILAPAMGWAHSGHGKTKIRAEVSKVKTKDQTVQVKMRVLNLGSQKRVLESVSASNAKTVAPVQPVNIAGFATAEVMVELNFSGKVPPACTVVLNFGGHDEVSLRVETGTG